MSALGPRPPTGLGLYARAELDTAIDWDFVAVNARTASARAVAQAARARGAEIWVYSGPESWTPTAWRAGLAQALQVARDVGAVGIIADPETDWPDLSRNALQTESAALARALVDASSALRVGVTSYPSWPGLPYFAPIARGSVFGAPQIYGRGAFDARAFAGWLERWRNALGPCIVSFAAWPANDAMRTADGFTRYLAMLPRTGGAIAWDGSPESNLPAYIATAIRANPPWSAAEAAIDVFRGSTLLAIGGAIALALILGFVTYMVA